MNTAKLKLPSRSKRILLEALADAMQAGASAGDVLLVEETDVDALRATFAEMERAAEKLRTAIDGLPRARPTLRLVR